MRTTIIALAIVLLAAPAHAQDSDYYFPAGQNFDPSVPTPEQFLGYAVGTHHTRHDRIVAYMQELARVSPRAEYRSIGRTYGEREMPVLTVTSPANLSRLEEIRRQHMMSTEPGGTAAPTSQRKVIVHLGYGVHGNETSSAEAAMLTAYWLVAARTPEMERFLDQGVYHVEPVLNPDGRDRHSHWANMHKSTPFVADPLDREHNEAWPGGRTNHYWFDLNRDWLPLENPESRARIEWHHAWRPNVVTDYHEMGANSTYFFEPSKPIGSWNPLLPERLYTEITLDFAEHWAAALDEIGSLYFTKEVYDNMYPGYGSSYPNFLGGLGLVFEQASARGHIQESSRQAGVLTFPFAIRNHLRTSIGTVRAAVQHREKLLDYQRDFFASAIREGQQYPATAWVFGDPVDMGRNRAFLDLLLRHRIDVFELGRSVTANGHTFEPGRAWVVPAAQPMYRMARSIFERTSEYADSAFYDASTWTVSLAYNMPDAELNRAPPLGARVSSVPAPAGLGTVPQARYAYLLDWTQYGAPAALFHLLDNGVHAEVAFEPFTARTNTGEQAFGRGTISIPVGVQNMPADRLRTLVLEAEQRGSVPIRSVETGYAVRGPDLGSGSFRPLDRPDILMVIGDGVSSYDAGQIWHMMDTKFGIPMTKVDSRDFNRANLADYDVLILPSGSYGFIAGDRLEELKRWVRGGGTVIATRSAAQWAISNGLAPNTAMVERPTPPELGRRDYADADAIRGPQAIGGSIWQADLDITHPLGFGYTRRALPVWRDHSIFVKPSTDPFGTVVQLTADPHLSGFISDANLERLRNSPSLIADGLGSGTVVLMLDNPNFRGYWLGTNRLLLNAIFFGPLL